MLLDPKHRFKIVIFLEILILGRIWQPDIFNPLNVVLMLSILFLLITKWGKKLDVNGFGGITWTTTEARNLMMKNAPDSAKRDLIRGSKIKKIPFLKGEIAVSISDNIIAGIAFNHMHSFPDDVVATVLINGQPGNSQVIVPKNLVGIMTDTTHSDTFSSGDKVVIQIITGKEIFRWPLTER